MDCIQRVAAARNNNIARRKASRKHTLPLALEFYTMAPRDVFGKMFCRLHFLFSYAEFLSNRISYSSLIRLAPFNIVLLMDLCPIYTCHTDSIRSGLDPAACLYEYVYVLCLSN